MSDQHAGRSFRKGAPRGTVHKGHKSVYASMRSDPSVYARLAADLDGAPKGTPGKKALIKYEKLAKERAEKRKKEAE